MVDSASQKTAFFLNIEDEMPIDRDQSFSNYQAAQERLTNYIRTYDFTQYDRATFQAGMQEASAYESSQGVMENAQIENLSSNVDLIEKIIAAIDAQDGTPVHQIVRKAVADTIAEAAKKPHWIHHSANSPHVLYNEIESTALLFNVDLSDVQQELAMRSFKDLALFMARALHRPDVREEFSAYARELTDFGLLSPELSVNLATAWEHALDDVEKVEQVMATTAEYPDAHQAMTKHVLTARKQATRRLIGMVPAGIAEPAFA